MRLKRLRRFLSLGFFISLALVFLDIHDTIPHWVYDPGLYLQFMPSIVQGLGDLTLSAAGCILILGLTLILGRIYCSVVCPLGGFMDIIAWMKRKTGRSVPHSYARPRTKFRYGILMATLLCLASGSMVMVNLLDPFSNFGRMAVALARPLVILGNNGAARALETMGSYAIPPLPLKGIALGMIVFSLGFAVLVCWLALTRGRLYCNMICPVGTLLGLFAGTAPLKIHIREKDCIDCGNCEQACKSDCIDIKTRHIDHSRCLVCFNCLDTCPTGAAVYGRAIPGTPAKGPGTHTRRDFLAAAATALTLLPRTSQGSNKIQVTVPNTLPVPKSPHPILPPGALSLNRFTAACTACHACVARCPSQVLQPSLTQYGLSGLFMPFMDLKTGYCNLNCNLCSQICPTRAITPFSLDQKKKIQTGTVKFILKNCVAELQKTDCGACSEHCPTKAVAMVARGKIKIPKVNEKICLGCGACEHVCPAKPNKAIYVRPHTVHQQAQAPPKSRLPVPDSPEGGDGFNF